MMKILNVNHLLDPLTGGGTAERTFQMSRFLSKAGTDCRILTSDIGISADLMKSLSPIEIYAVPCFSKRFYIPKNGFTQIWRMVRETDIIHLMGHWTLLNVLVYLFARRLNKPYVVCPAGSLPIFGRSKIFKVIYNFVIGKRILKNAHGYIAITNDEISHFKPYKVDEHKIIIIPNGIDAGQYSACDDSAFRNKFGLSSEPFILFVGRLNLIKGPDLLLHAFAKTVEFFPNHLLVFAGPDGGMLSELKNTARELAIEKRIHFPGFIGGELKSQAYHAAQLLVIPSRSEAMSIVALEAGITGTPILLTDQCGFNQISDIEGGIVVTASVTGIQEGLIKLLRDNSRLQLMGENLKKFISKNYLWENLASNYINFYKKILRTL